MRRILVSLGCTLLLAGCGAHARDPSSIADLPIDERAITLPDAIPAVPIFELTLDGPLTEKQRRGLETIQGVEVVTELSAKTIPVKTSSLKRRLEVAAVEPIVFRSVAPPATRDADFVWVSLVMGRSVPSFDAARRLGIEGVEELDIGAISFEVGAIADNGLPNIADLLVQNGAAKALGLGPPRTVIVGARTGASVDDIGAAIRRHLPKAETRRLVKTPRTEIPEPADATPLPMGQVSGGTVGTMTFQILKNGFIRPDPSWVEANIARGTVPILGEVTCHRFLFPRLGGALGDLAEEGLDDLIDPRQYGGCYVPRFIDRDPNKPLSMHAFGLAVDLNVRANPLGSRGRMDPRVVEIFEAWGFEWGGLWARPDPMHFELR